MTPFRVPRLAAYSLLALAALAACQGTGQETPEKTTLKVLLPQKRSRITVDGVTYAAKGKAATAEREVAVPAPPSGKKEHEVTVRWRTNDYTVFFRDAKVKPKPGGTVTLDLSKPDPKTPDRIEIRYVPTPEDVVARMCKLGSIGKDDVVYDLGCGDGRMVIMAVRDFGAKSGVGIDLDKERVRESKENAKAAMVDDKVEFRLGDVLHIKDLSKASVVLLYMGDDVNERLRPILQKTLKPGSRIVSHRFLMGDWKPEKTEKFEAADGDEYEIHLWTVGKK